MSFLLEGQDKVQGSESLASHIVGKVRAWEERRDSEYHAKWMEYYRIWRGVWAPEDRDRISERSHAIMPALSQAVDSAVAEQEEATFGRERWFDIDIANTAEEELQELARAYADLALQDLRHTQADVSRVYLIGALYGTGIGKIQVTGSVFDGIKVNLIPIEPFNFVIDPAAHNIPEAEGVAHCFLLPYNVVIQRQREGIYAKRDPGSRPQAIETRQRKTGELAITDTQAVDMIEWHGLVPRGMLPPSERPVSEGKLKYEDDEPVEAIVTIANDNVVLKAVSNPFKHQDRSFVAYQHDTVPNRFWGRGIVEKGYWPQKVLDSEIRARIDALAFSTHPMVAMNASAVPRNSNFRVRPGANIFLNGSVGEENLRAFNFPPPDPQTYTQSSEMQRMVEMATGQLQAATPIGVNARNSTASGMSMILGAQIRRTKRTMANIERDFLRPFIKKSLWRLQQFDEDYPKVEIPIKVFGTLGIMAREFEQVQLTQMLNSLPPGPQSLLIMRAIIDNSSLVEKQDMIEIVDQLIQQSMQPQEPPRDLAGEARLLSAQVGAQKAQADQAFEQARLQLEAARLQVSKASEEANHQRGVMALSVEQDKADAAQVESVTGGILDLAKAEAEALKGQLSDMKTPLSTINPPPSPAQPSTEPTELNELRAMVEDLMARTESENEDELSEIVSPIQIERDSNGLVTSVNGRNVVRDNNGLIQELR